MKLYIIFKKNIKFCYVILTLVLLSCDNDYLNIQAYGVPVVEDFYKTPLDAEQALNAAYSPLREMYGGEFFNGTLANDIVFGDVGTDDFIKGGNSVDNLPQLLEKETFSIQTTNTYLEAIWKVNFKGVLYTNLILNKGPGIKFEDESVKKQLLAEAHFLRAYYYFYLVRTYGGVPLMDKLLEFDEYNVPRASKEAIYAFIEDDLKIAIADLPSRFTKPTSYLGHADKGAALGMMMRVSLYQNKMAQVKTYGDQFFLIPGYVLPNYTTIFQKEGEWNSGSLFEIDYSANTSNLGTGLIRRISPVGGKFLQVKDELRNEFEPNDPRLAASFYYKDTAFGTDWFNKKYAVAPYSNYPAPTLNVSYAENNIRLLRLSDVYLMYAEAIYNSDPATAVIYVNKVRSKARGTNPSTVLPDLLSTLRGQPLLNAIWHERRVELAGEGLRFYDLVRTGRAKTIMGSLGFVEGKHEVMPIPNSQVILSKGILKQNNY